MGKKLFFLIVFGLALSFTTKAQGTQQVIAKLVNVPDIYYSGVDTLSTDYITNRLKNAVQFTLADGTTVVSPSFTLSQATISQINQGVLIQNGVSVVVDLTPGGGYGFLPAGAPAGSYVSSTSITGAITIRPLPLEVVVAAGAVADKNYNGDSIASIKDASKITFKVDASATAAYLDPSIVVGTTAITVPDSVYTVAAVYDSPDAGTRTATVKVELLNPAASNYTIKNGSPATLSDAGVKINPAKLTIASIAFASTTKVYDGSPLTVTGVTFAPAITPVPALGTDYTVTGTLPVDAGVFTGDTVSPIVTLGASFNPNYVLAAADNKVPLGAYSISPVQLTVTALGQKLLYDGTDNVPFDVSTKGVAFTVTPDLAGVTFTGGLEWAKNRNVGAYAISQGTLATTSSNYYINFVFPPTAKDTITPLAVTIQAPDTTIAYGSTLDRAKQLIPTVTPALAPGDKITGSYTIYDITGATVLNDPLSVGTDSIGKSNKATGNKTIDDGNGGDNYTITYIGGLLTVNNARTLTVTPKAGQFKTYGEPDPAFEYTVTGFATQADSLNAVFTGSLSYNGSATPVAKSDAGTYDFTIGDLAIANPNYTLTLASPAVSFEIRKANVIVTPKAKSNELGSAQTLFAYVDVFDVALLNGDVAATVFTGKTITRNGAKNSATATPLATDSVGFYDYKIDPALSAANLTNYNLILTSVRPLAQYEITPATVYVMPDSLQGKGFGEADPTLTYKVVNAGNVEITPAVTLTGTLGRAAGENIGEYAYNVAGLTNPDYTVQLSAKADKFTISKGVIEVDVKDTTGVYGSAAFDLDAAYYVVKPEVPAGTLTGTVKRNGQNSAINNPTLTDSVGVYDVLQGTLAVADPNYSLVFHAGTYTITPKALTVTPDAGSKEYGNDDPVFTYTVEGLVGNDSVAAVFTGALDRISGYNVGTYAIINGLQADSLRLVQPSNYSYNPATDFTPGVTFAITPAPLTVYPNAASKTYGQADTAASPAVFAAITDANRTAVIDSIRGWKLGAATGLNVDDDSKLTGKLVRVAGNDAGKYNYLADSLAVLSNYTVVIGGSKQFTINPKAIVVTPVDTSKYFGQADPAIRFTVNSTALVSPDDIDNFATGHLTRVAGEDVGFYDINNVGSDSLQAKNYLLTIATGKKFEIKKATLTEDDLNIVWEPVPVYDGNPYGLSFSNAGIPTNAFGISYNGREGNPVNAGAYDVIITIAATPNNNQSVITLSKPFVIAKAEVTVTIDSLTKVSGSTDPAFTYVAVYTNPDPETHVGVLPGIPFTGKLERVAGEAAGTYTISKGSLAAGGNYELTFVDGALTITPGTGINNIVAEGQVSIYPSVAQRNSTITLDANVNVKNAALSVYNVNGQLISVTPVVNTVTTLSAPSEAGAYIYVFKAEDVNKTMRVLVK